MCRAFLSRVLFQPGVEGAARFGQEGSAEPAVDSLELCDGIVLHILEPDVADTTRRLARAKFEASRQVERQPVSDLTTDCVPIDVVGGDVPERREHTRGRGQGDARVAMGLDDSSIWEDLTKIIEKTEMLRCFQDPTFTAFTALFFLPLEDPEHTRQKFIARSLVLLL